MQNSFGCFLQVAVTETSGNIVGILRTHEVRSFSLGEYTNTHLFLLGKAQHKLIFPPHFIANISNSHFITYTSKQFYFLKNNYYFQRYILRSKQALFMASLHPKNVHKFHLKAWKMKYFRKIKIACRNVGHFCLYSSECSYASLLQSKSGNRKKTMRSRGAMQETERERSCWINEEKSQATGFPGLVVWYNVESQDSGDQGRIILTRVLISRLTHRKAEDVVFLPHMQDKKP